METGQTTDQKPDEKPKTYGHKELRDFLNELQYALADKGIWDKDEWKIAHWFVQRLVRWPGKQQQHLDELHLWYIPALRSKGFSIAGIAFVLDRSKSTVHGTVKRIK